MAESMPTTEACTVLAHQEMCVDADVSVTPDVHAGPAMTKCVGGPHLEVCTFEEKADGRETCTDGHDGGHCHPKRRCRFKVRQVICVTVPLTFGATAEAEVSAVECGTPRPGPCMN